MSAQADNRSDEAVTLLAARVTALELKRVGWVGTVLSILALIVSSFSAYGTYRNSEASTRKLLLDATARQFDLRVREWEFPRWFDLESNPSVPKSIRFRVINKGIPVVIESITLLTLVDDSVSTHQGEFRAITNEHGVETWLRVLFTKYTPENSIDDSKALPLRLETDEGEVFAMSYSVDIVHPRLRVVVSTGESFEYVVYEPPPPTSKSGAWGYNDGGGKPIHSSTDD